ADADADIGHERRAGAEVPGRVEHAVDDMDAARGARIRAGHRCAAQAHAETAVAVHLDRADIVAREIETELGAELAELPARSASGHEAAILFRAEIEARRPLPLEVVLVRPAAFGAHIRTVGTGIGLVRTHDLRVAARGGQRRQRDAQSQSATKLHAIPP